MFGLLFCLHFYLLSTTHPLTWLRKFLAEGVLSQRLEFYFALCSLLFRLLFSYEGNCAASTTFSLPHGTCRRIFLVTTTWWLTYNFWSRLPLLLRIHLAPVWVQQLLRVALALIRRLTLSGSFQRLAEVDQIIILDVKADTSILLCFICGCFRARTATKKLQIKWRDQSDKSTTKVQV